MDTSLVHSYENEDYSIIWNVSAGDIHNPEYKKEYSKIMVEIDECQSTNDVKFFDNWTIVKKVKKEKSCSRKCVEKDLNLKKNIQSGVGFGLLLEEGLEAKNNNPTDETNCKWWCDRVANSADLMCLEHFKSSKCQYVCMKAVEKTKKWCHGCCTGDGFYKNCVKPFENFLERVGCEVQFGKKSWHGSNLIKNGYHKAIRTCPRLSLFFPEIRLLNLI